MAKSIFAHQLDVTVGVNLNDAQRKATSAQIKAIASEWQGTLDAAIRQGIEDGAKTASLQDVLTQFNTQLKAFKLEPLQITVDELKIMDKPIEHAANLVIQRLGASIKGGGIGNIISSEITDSLNTLGGTVDKIYKRMEQGAKKSAANIDKSMSEIAAAADQYTTQTSMRKISTAISSNPKKSTAEANIKDLFTSSVSAKKSGETWDKQYLADVNFVKNYRKVDTEKLKQIFGDTFQQVESYYNNLAKVHQQKIIALNDILAQKEFVDTSKKNPVQYQFKGEPWARENTLQQVKQILSGGLTVKGGSSDGNDGSGSSQSLNTSKLDNDLKNVIEARTNAEKRAEDAAKAIALIQEKMQKQGFNVYRGINEEDAVESREDGRFNYSAEYWAKDKKTALSYAIGSEDGTHGQLLSAFVAPKKPLVLDAEGHEYSDIKNMTALVATLEELGMNIRSLISNGPVSADEIQQNINEFATNKGYDSVITNNVKDANIDGGPITSTIAVLDDSILSTVQAFDVIEGELQTAATKIAEWYHAPDQSKAAKVEGVANEELENELVRLRKEQETAMKDTKKYTKQELDLRKRLEKANKSDISQEHISQAKNQNMPAQDESGVHKSNADAIDAEANAQQKLNDAENHNPPAKDDSSIHNANTDAINTEEQAQKRLNERRSELVSQLSSLSKDVSTTEDARSQLTEREKVFQMLQKEDLLNDQIKADYEEVNAKLKEKLELLEQSANANKRSAGETSGSSIISDMLAKAKARAAKEAEEEKHTQEGISAELEKQNQLLLYRRGKTSWNPDRFRNNDMMGNSIWNSNVASGNNPNGFLPYDFGGFGDGLYGSIISAAEDLKGKLLPGESYFEIDASKYKMYINQTVEQAERLQEFLLQLQKFVLAGGQFRGFDAELTGVSNESLFADAQSIFESFNMTREQFDAWITSMKQIVNQNGLNDKGVWTKADEKFLNSHNFGTRFMKNMGYEGVLNATGDVGYDGNGEGSVIYDPDFKQLEGHLATTGHKFETNEEYLAYLDSVKQKVMEGTQAYIESNTAIDANTNAKNRNSGDGVGSGAGSGAIQEEIDGANQLADVLQRVEAAYKELDALNADPWSLKNEEEVNRILQERLAIIQRVGAENLKAHNPGAYADVEAINNEHLSAIDSFRASKDDAIYENLDKNFGYYNDVIETSQNLEVLLAKRRELMQGIHFDAEQEYVEQEQINQAIEHRIALMKQLEPLVANGSITQGQLEDMVLEQGTLHERRSMLEGVQQNLFNSEPEDLSEAQYVLDQYEKIFVKTAGGKKLTLGPEMSEADWKSFMKMDPEKAKSIEFIRKEIQAQEQMNAVENQNPKAQDDTGAHNTNADAINAEADAQKKLNDAETKNPPAQDDSGVHNANADAAIAEAQAQEKLSIVKAQAASTQSNVNTAIVNTGKAATSPLRPSAEGLEAHTYNPSEKQKEYVLQLGEEYRAIMSILERGDSQFQSALMERARAITNIMMSTVKGSDGEIGHMYESGYGGSHKTAMSLSNWQQRDKLLYKVDSDKINDTQRQAAIDLIYKEIEAEKQLEEVNRQRKEAEKQQKVDAFQSQYISAAEEEKSLLQDIIELYKELKRLYDMPDKASHDAALSTTIREKESSLEKMNAGLFYAYDDVGPVVAGKYIDGLPKITSDNSGVHNANADAIKTETDALQKLNDVEGQNPIPKDDSGVHKANTEAIDSEVHAQEKLKAAKVQGNATPSPQPQTPPAVNTGNIISENAGQAISGEVSSLQTLKAAVDDVTTSISQKTDAFTNEATEVARVAAAEIASLQPLEERINAIRDALTAVIQGVQGGGDLAGTLGNLNIKVTTTNEDQQNNEALVSAIKSALGGISNIKLDSTSIAQEGTLGRVAAACEAINAKIVGSVSGEVKAAGGSKDADVPETKETKKESSKTSKKTEESKKESEAVKELIGLYKELGRLQAELDSGTAGANRTDVLKKGISSIEELIAEKQKNVKADQQAFDTAKLEAYDKKLREIELREAKKQDTKAFNKAVQEAKKEAGVNKANSAINKASETFKAAAGIENITPENLAILENYNAKIAQLKASHTEISQQTGPATPEQQQRLREQTQEVDTLTAKISGLVEEYNRLSGANTKPLNATHTLTPMSSIADYENQLRTAVIKDNPTAKITSFDAATKQLTYTIKTGKHEITSYTAQLRGLDNQLVTTQGQTKRVATFFETVGAKIKQLISYYSGMMLIYRAIAIVRKGITYIKEIDSALTELKKVTDETEETYERFLDTASKTAEKVGSTTQKIISSAADWARLNI